VLLAHGSHFVTWLNHMDEFMDAIDEPANGPVRLAFMTFDWIMSCALRSKAPTRGDE